MIRGSLIGLSVVVAASGIVVGGSAAGAQTVDPACAPLFTGKTGASTYPPEVGTDFAQLDVVQGDMHNSASTLTGVLTVENLESGPTAPPPGSTAIEYYLEWTFKSTTYFLNAEVAATGNSFSYGTYGSGTGQNTFTTLGAATGTVNTGSDGTIVMSVPLTKVGSPADGATLTAPQALVGALAGAPSNPSGVSGGEIITASKAGPGNDYTLGEVCPSTGQPGSDGGTAAPGGGTVPEAPLTIGIPLVGVALSAGLIIRRRRRLAVHPGGTV